MALGKGFQALVGMIDANGLRQIKADALDRAPPSGKIENSFFKRAMATLREYYTLG